MIFSNVKKIVIPAGEARKIESGGVVLWKGGYTNLVPTSIDTNGTVFNGTGYRDGYRLSSSGSLSSQANTTTSGFIPCKPTDTIRMGGVNWRPTSGFCYIAFYDAAFVLLGSINIEGGTNVNTARGIVDKSKTSIVEADGVTRFQMGFSDGSKVAYFRINGFGRGADMIVTVNEEIS